MALLIERERSGDASILAEGLRPLMWLATTIDAARAGCPEETLRNAERLWRGPADATSGCGASEEA
jgi:hypothetical protein